MRALPRSWLIVAALSLTTTAGYGVLAYAFAVLLVPMQHDLGAGRAMITGAQAACLVAGGLTAVPVGRWLDRRGGRAVMFAGSIASTALVYAWSTVDTVLELYLVSIGMGISGAGVLYEAAFAVVVRWFGTRQRSTAILVITTVGGFASTIFLPLTGFLTAAYGWRQALVVLAVIYGTVTIPLHLLVRNPPAVQGERPPEPATPSRRAALRTALRDRSYWLITLGFVTEGGANAVIAVHLVAYLIELGHPPTFAATVAGLLGVLSVAGRLVTTFLQRRRSLTAVVGAIFAVQAVGAALLPALGGSVGGAVACILAFGIGQGVSTIARPVLLAERYALQVYATLAGLLAGLMLLVKAFAPLGAAILHTLAGGYLPVMIASAAGCLVGAGCLLAVGGRRPPARQVAAAGSRR